MDPPCLDGQLARVLLLEGSKVNGHYAGSNAYGSDRWTAVRVGWGVDGGGSWGVGFLCAGVGRRKGSIWEGVGGKGDVVNNHW